MILSLPRSLAAIALIVLVTASASGRLNETEAQSQARYGAPQPDLISPDEQPLLPGAKEVAYKHEGWRIRAAFLNGKTVRIEYAKIPDASGLKKLTEAEVKTILEAEQGNFRWREEKPRTGSAELDALKTTFDGRLWERSDHALARLKVDLLLTLETREVAAYEKRQAKQTGKDKGKPAPKVPSF